MLFGWFHNAHVTAAVVLLASLMQQVPGTSPVAAIPHQVPVLFGRSPGMGITVDIVRPHRAPGARPVPAPTLRVLPHGHRWQVTFPWWGGPVPTWFNGAVVVIRFIPVGHYPPGHVLVGAGHGFLIWRWTIQTPYKKPETFTMTLLLS